MISNFFANTNDSFKSFVNLLSIGGFFVYCSVCVEGYEKLLENGKGSSGIELDEIYLLGLPKGGKLEAGIGGDALGYIGSGGGGGGGGENGYLGSS